MKLCTNCKYFNHRDYLQYHYGFVPDQLIIYMNRKGFTGRCHHPKLLSPIDGSTVTTCDQARSPVYGDCGRDGTLHEQITNEELAEIKKEFNTHNEEKRESWERVTKRRELESQPVDPAKPTPVGEQPFTPKDQCSGSPCTCPDSDHKPWWKFWRK